MISVLQFVPQIANFIVSPIKLILKSFDLFTCLNRFLTHLPDLIHRLFTRLLVFLSEGLHFSGLMAEAFMLGDEALEFILRLSQGPRKSSQVLLLRFASCMQAVKLSVCLVQVMHQFIYFKLVGLLVMLPFLSFALKFSHFLLGLFQQLLVSIRFLCGFWQGLDLWRDR